MTENFSANHLAHRWMAERVRPGDFCIDATAGRGRDTAYLCGLVGSAGRVLAMDIQPEAIESTRLLLEEQGLSQRAELILDGHENMAKYASGRLAACVAFNFGWLPGGSHDIFTLPETSVTAVAAALDLLKPGGFLTLCLYYGRENGFKERDALLEYLRALPSPQYTALVCAFHNRANNPPIPVLVTRDA